MYKDNITIIVEDLHNPMRVDKFLSNHNAITDLYISRQYLQKLIDQGDVTIENKKVKPSMKLKGGEEITINIPNPESAIPEPVNIPINMLYEDDDIIVLYKPVGLTVHPSAGHINDTLVNALLYHCKSSLSSIGGITRPGIVHRLDKDTSGVMVVAKNDKAHQHLSLQFSEHTIERHYEAICYGSPKTPAGVIISNIGRSPRNRQKMAVLQSGGKNAVTHFKVLKQAFYNDYLFSSIIRFTLETGRTHQIRVHSSNKGFSIIGDPLYGSHSNFLKKLPDNIKNEIISYKTQALHAYHLGFVHPSTQEHMIFKSDPSEQYKDLKKNLFG